MDFCAIQQDGFVITFLVSNARGNEMLHRKMTTRVPFLPFVKQRPRNSGKLRCFYGDSGDILRHISGMLERGIDLNGF